MIKLIANLFLLLMVILAKAQQPVIKLKAPVTTKPAGNSANSNKSKDTVPALVAVQMHITISSGLRKSYYLQNGDFEIGVGRSIPGWTIAGNGFFQVSGSGQYRWTHFNVVNEQTVGGDYWRDLPFHIGHHRQRWIGSTNNQVYGNTNSGDEFVGTMSSQPFKIYPNQRFLSFLISGGNNSNDLKVELLKMAVGVRLNGDIRAQPQVPGIGRVPQRVSTASDTSYISVAGIPGKTGHNNDIFRREWWDLRNLDTSAFYIIRITDNMSQVNYRWGHINVDDFKMMSNNPAQLNAANDSTRIQQITVPDMASGNKQTIWVDYYTPINGSADTHTHLMSHLSMGRKLVHGVPDIGSIVPAGTHKRGFDAFKPECNPTDERATSVEMALGNCDATHGGWGVENDCGNYIRAALLNVFFDSKYIHRVPFEVNAHGDHPHAGYPNFVHWPNYSSASHQQMYVDWIRRAYEGGMRVMVTLTVNSELLGAMLAGDPPYADKAVADQQLDEIKKFVERHNDFMELALNPGDLRRIVKSGKLAIIMGMEVDNWGDFNYPSVEATASTVKAEIQRLYTKGVRYFFPIHLVNNKMGGSAIYSPLFNLSNKYVNSRPLPWGATIPPGKLFVVQNAIDRDITYTLKLFDAPPGTVNALLPLANAVLDGIGSIPFPPAFDLFKCPTPTLGCIDQFKIVKGLLGPDPAWDIYNRMPGGIQNTVGLSTLGELAIREMMRLGMIIDIDHMSDKSAAAVLAIAKENRYPVISGHNGLRTGFSEEAGHKHTENNRSADQLAIMSDLGGVFGLGSGEQTSASYLTNFRKALPLMKNRALTMGSDINGMVVQTLPRHDNLNRDRRNRYPTNSDVYRNWNRRVIYNGDPKTGMKQYKFANKSWDYNTEGMAHMGLYPDFYQDLKNLGMTYDERKIFFSAAENIVSMWEKCEPYRARGF